MQIEIPHTEGCPRRTVLFLSEPMSDQPDEKKSFFKPSTTFGRKVDSVERPPLISPPFMTCSFPKWCRRGMAVEDEHAEEVVIDERITPIPRKGVQKTVTEDDQTQISHRPLTPTPPQFSPPHPSIIPSSLELEHLPSSAPHFDQLPELHPMFAGMSPQSTPQRVAATSLQAVQTSDEAALSSQMKIETVMGAPSDHQVQSQEAKSPLHTTPGRRSPRYSPCKSPSLSPSTSPSDVTTVPMLCLDFAAEEKRSVTQSVLLSSSKRWGSPIPIGLAVSQQELEQLLEKVYDMQPHW